MIVPDYLKKGDLIRIVSPSGKIQEEKVCPAVKLLREEGFEVIVGEHVLDSHFQFAGTDKQRLDDLQTAFDDPRCKAIICSRGGYGAIRIAGNINFSKFIKNPKWLVGFSDITVLHVLLQKKGLCSIHGAMTAFYLKEDKPTESYRELLKILKGEKNGIQAPACDFNRPGLADGQLTGGNLSILYSMLGTSMDPNTDGKILFIEDISEYLYHLDRMMHGLKFSGKLKNLKGLVAGGFTEMVDNDSPFGQSIEEIILDAVKEYNYPVCFNFPSGHLDRNMPLVLGTRYQLTVSQGESSLRIA